LTHKRLKIISLAAFFITIILIAVLFVLPEDFFHPPKKEWRQSRVLEPNLSENLLSQTNDDLGRMVYEHSLKPLIELEDGEIQIAALSEDFDGDGADEQIIAYRNLLEKNNPIYITYIDYLESTKTYKRLWSASTRITKQGSLSLFTMDLIGDHTNTLIATGMDQYDEQTLTAFKLEQKDPDNVSYKKIADLHIDGVISILETERSQAYQLGFARGFSFNIIDRGRDLRSGNALDQIEHTYTYDPADDSYKKTGEIKIPGAQIEAKRLRELLSGDKNEFEQFIDGLWYHVSREGTVDNEQYIYFDTSNREVIFYSEDTQQVYEWQSSFPTRYGIYISSQNISVSTLNRKINLELESLDSIRIKVSEDVRMRIVMNAPWDGSYRKAIHIPKTSIVSVSPYADEAYNSPIGKILFSPDGVYKIELNGTYRNGKYSFFMLEGTELLEFVPDENLEIRSGQTLAENRSENESTSSYAGNNRVSRQTYKVERNKNKTPEIFLTRVRLGTNGMTEFSEAPLPLSLIVE
jgi:hypothetical protein